MPTARQQVSYPGVSVPNTNLQALAVLAQIWSTLDAAGYIRVRTTTDGIGRFYRYPPLDGYSSRSDLCYFSNANGGGSVFMGTVQDFDVQTAASPTSFVGPNGASGLFNPSAFPVGPPVINALGNSGSSNGLAATNLAFTLTTYASEYGWVAIYDDGVANDFKVATAMRPLTSYRHPRTLRFTTKNAAFPITFAAPSGPAHLSFDIDGNPLSVTFPTGVPLSAGRIVQEITMQTAGYVEADIEEDFGNTSLVIRLPYDAEPVLGFSSTLPRFAITFIDATADALGLAIFVGAVDALSTSALTMNGVEWVLQQVRIGAKILNRTQGGSTAVTGFATAASQSDTLVATFPGGWLKTDTFVVLPGPETWIHGPDLHAACLQGCPQLNSGVKTHLSGTVTYVLNDLLGEAQGHYQIGQNVMVASNGTAPILTLTGVGGFVVGDVVTDVGTAASGILRAIYPGSAEIIVDVISYPTNAPAFVVGHTVTGAKGGSATISSIRTVTSDTTIGWYQRVPVAGIGQVSPATGDYRTTLMLDLSGMTANARLSPCVVIGPYGRLVMQTVLLSIGSTDPPPFQANQSNTGIALTNDTDVGRTEAGPLGVNSPAKDPDWETGSLVLCEAVGRFAGGLGNTSNDILFLWPHFRSVSARNGAFVAGDAIDENGDPVRRWRMVKKHTGNAYGALEPGLTDHFWTFGPGAL